MIKKYDTFNNVRNLQDAKVWSNEERIIGYRHALNRITWGKRLQQCTNKPNSKYLHQGNFVGKGKQLD